MRPVYPYLHGSTRPLTEVYDVALLDLDGVVYIGASAVPSAPEALAAARQAGMRLAFVTNNASRTPSVVADHLTALGIPATADEIVTSAQAAAHYLADRLPAHARVLVVGTTGLEQALRERGLVPVADATGEVDAVVQGYSPDLTWRLLAEGAVAINRGVPWVATNVDPTVPSPRGRLPGNGSMVAALRHATGVEPIVTGKPDPTMHRESVQRSGARRPIVVGDRLDTDIEGANAVGCDSLLVLSGVTSARELLQAPPARRPAFVAADLRGLLVPHEQPVKADSGVVCGRWRATRSAGREGSRLVLRLHARSGPGEPAHEGRSAPDDDLDALRALCAALWDEAASSVPDDGQADRSGRLAQTVDLHVGVDADGDDMRSRQAAADVLARLGLT
jgi:HAD superfamily hydrolase (TIGR01450 family)